MGEVNNDLYAVTDEGHFIVVTAAELAGGGEMGRLLRTIPGVSFSGLTHGPANLPEFADKLFATTSNGELYAFNTDGTYAEILGFAEENVSLELASVTGLAFANLDTNLWHRTNQREGDDGHNPGPTDEFSLRFGYTDERLPGIATDLGVTYEEAHETYNFIGGASGQVESDPFDLLEYAPDDEPTMYFSYFLDTPDDNSIDFNSIEDSFRVYISSEQNRQWTLVGTNNEAGRYVGNDYLDGRDEYDVPNSYYVEPDTGALVDPYQFVQILHDEADWRQARIRLAPWAGHSDVRLRFDFSSAGEPEINVLELRAVRPQLMLDTQEFDFQLASPTTQLSYEFDFGLVMTLPGGAAIQDGSQIQIRNVDNGFSALYTFRDENGPSPGNGPLDISINDSLTAAEVVVRFAAKLNAAFDVTVDPQEPERFSIESVGTTDIGLVSGFNTTDIVVERPGITTASTLIPIGIDTTVTQVRDLIRVNIADGFNPTAPNPSSTTNIDLLVYSREEDIGDVVMVENLTLISGDDSGILFDGIQTLQVSTDEYAYLDDGEFEVVILRIRRHRWQRRGDAANSDDHHRGCQRCPERDR